MTKEKRVEAKDNSQSYNCNVSRRDYKQRDLFIEKYVLPFLKGVKLTSSGMTYIFHYDSDLVHYLLDLILIEQDCCRFLVFSLDFNIIDRRILLHVSSSSVDGEVVQEVFREIIPIGE